MRLWKQFALAIVMSVAAVGTTDAGVITNGTVSVGITPNGNLFDGGIGFRRLAGSVDPISPGTPKEAWGASIGAVGSRVDPFGFGITNIVANGSSFLPASATTSSFVNNGANRMRVDHSFSFVASNAMAIDVKMTNVSGASGTALYRRIGDWDLGTSGSPFFETITANALSGPVVNGTFQGFQNPDPLAGLGSLFPAGGGTSGPGDLGGGVTLDFGTLANGASTDFRLIYAIGTPGQTEAQLRAQLAALGAFYIITGIGPATGNVFGLGVVAAIPEPASMTVFGAVAIGGVVTLLRRRKVVA